MSQRLVRKLWALPSHRRRLLIEAAVWLVLSRLALLFFEFRRIVRALGLTQEEAPETVASGEFEPVGHVRWAVEAVASRLPWESSCLVRALAAIRMLGRLGVPGKLTLGVAKEAGASQSIMAHAWVRCGDAIVTGGGELDRFSPIGHFSLPPARTYGTTDRSPEVTERLLLGLLRGSGELQFDSTAGRLTHHEWQTLARTATRLGVGNLLSSRLRETGLAALLPADVMGRLRASSLRTAANNCRAFAEHDSLVGALAEAGVRALSLKGAFLARVVYSQPAQRPMVDLDFLIRPEDVAAAISVLERLGYVSVQPFVLADSLVAAKELPPFRKRGAAVDIDLHWRLGDPEKGRVPDATTLFAHAVELAGSECLWSVPSHEDHLLFLAIHAAQEHNFEIGLAPFCDARALLNWTGGAIDWEAVVLRSRHWRCSRSVHLLLWGASEWLDAPVPVHVLETLQPPGFDDAIAAQVRRRVFFTESQERERSISLPLALAWTESNLTSRIVSAFSRLTLGRQRLAAKSGTQSSSPGIALQYFARPFRLMRHFGSGMLRLLLGDTAARELACSKATVARWLDEE